MTQAIISLKPNYGNLILSGDKTVELRKQSCQGDSGDEDLDLRDTPCESYSRSGRHRARGS